jgi:RimJ/RimL family protein N-acetyltransferase
MSLNRVCLFEDNVRIVPYGPEHDQQTVEWLNGAELRETFGLSRSITRETHRHWLEHSRDVLIWAIMEKEVSHCGNVLLHCAWTHRSAYFQIYLGNPLSRGHGVGSKVLRAVTTYTFGELGLHRIWLHTLNGNAQAERMYRGAGFELEGTEREAILRDGVFHSQSRWSLLAHEWRGEGRGGRQ